MWDEVGRHEILKLFMLIGEYRHTMDEKNRLSVPAKFRKELGKKIIMTRGLDRCLFVYPVAEWKKFSSKLAALSIGSAEGRGFSRAMLGGAMEVEVDGSGRVLVPDHLKSYAGLATKIIVAGIHNRVELWNEEDWNNYTAGVESKANDLAQKLSDIGMI